MKTIIICFLIVLSTSTIFSNTQSNGIEPNPYSIVGSIISPDGNWLLYSKLYSKTQTPGELRLINTKTKEELSTTYPSNLFQNLLKEDLGIYKVDQSIYIVDFTKPDFKEQRKDIIKYDTDRNHNLLYTLSKDGNLMIEKLLKNKKNTVFQAINVKKYFLNIPKTFLIYQEKGDAKNIFAIDLQTFKKQLLTSIDSDLQTLEWNLSQDAILFNYEDSNNQMLINLKDQTIRKIELPLGQYSYFEKSFYSNNDILIKYNISTNEKYPESEYLDIWSSNSGSIITTDYEPKFKFNYYAKIYKYDSGQLIDLERDRFKEYLPIPIPNYVVYFNYFENQDFLHTYEKNTYYIENIKTKKSTFLTKVSQLPIFASPDNTKLLFQKEDSNTWEILDPETNIRLIINHEQIYSKPPQWSKDGKFIYYVNNNNLNKFEIKTQKTTKLTHFTKPTIIEIVNDSVGPSRRSLVDSTQPIFITVEIENKKAVFKIDKKNIVNISPFSTNNLPNKDQIRQNIDSHNKTIVLKEENYNLPHTLFISSGNKKELLLKSELEKEYNWLRRKKVSFKDSKGKDLEAFLYYPKNFDPSKNYPMITRVYTSAWKSLGANKFIPSTLLNGTGYNRTLLNELGYFVLTPDTYIDDRGPGLTAVDCVESAINEVLRIEPAISKDKIGLSGHSFGGYKASFIATQSKLFAAIESNSGIQDLIGSYTYKYNNARKLPEYSRVENSQFSMKQSFAENPQKYYDNSPLLNAHKIRTPILLNTGLEDENVHWEQTRTMFWALKRYNNTQFVALLYNNIGHAFNQYQENEKLQAKDYTMRYLDWWDYYLKDNKTIKWIDDAVNPSKISASFLSFR
ncbi:S9 family peptidase [Myroides sp. LJL115]